MPTILNMILSVINSNCLPLNCGVVSPILNVNPTYLSFLVKLLGDYRFTSVAITITYQVIFHPNFNHS